MFTRDFDGDLGGRRPDELIVEEPLTVDLDGHVVSSTMRTPGHDFELAAGFLLSEGLIGPDDVAGIRYCGTGSPVRPSGCLRNSPPRYQSRAHCRVARKTHFALLR